MENLREKVKELDLRESGAPKEGVIQKSERRLYMQFHAYGNVKDPQGMIQAIRQSGLECVLYDDVNDPRGVGVLILAEDPDVFVTLARQLLSGPVFDALIPKPEWTLLGRTYGLGREPDLEDWLLRKPRRNVFNPAWPWAVWYPLRRKPEFETLPHGDQGRILAEHGAIGRAYGEAGYAADVRLACHGLDKNDNEFVIGLIGAELFPLSKIVQDMRKTEQTSKYIQSLGPFFVGKVRLQNPLKT